MDACPLDLTITRKGRIMVHLRITIAMWEIWEMSAQMLLESSLWIFQIVKYLSMDRTLSLGMSFSTFKLSAEQEVTNYY